MPPSLPPPPPPPTTSNQILGGDVAGVVDEADEGGRFKKGDAVFALHPGFFNDRQDGCYAEYVAADEAWLARVPTDKLPLSEAAGLPLVALTAWQALEQAAPKAGERALITAAAGGVGHVAVQLAKARGLHVVAVAGPSNLEFVKSLGADEAIDYTSQDVGEALKASPVDISVDCMGTRSGLLQAILSGTRRHVSHILNAGTDDGVIGAANEAAGRGEGPAVSKVLVKPDGQQLQEVRLSDLGLMGWRLRLSLVRVENAHNATTPETNAQPAHPARPPPPQQQ